MSNYGDIKHTSFTEAIYEVPDTCAQLCFPSGQLQENMGASLVSFP